MPEAPLRTPPKASNDLIGALWATGEPPVDGSCPIQPDPLSKPNRTFLGFGRSPELSGGLRPFNLMSDKYYYVK